MIDSALATTPAPKQQHLDETRSPAHSLPDIADQERFPLLLEQWAKYEEVAMHFNDLLIKVRMRALGFISVVVIAAPTVLEDAKQVTVASGFLCGVWIILAILDLSYYTKLLQGAVAALKDLESKTKSRILLSTFIKHEVESAHFCNRWPWLKRCYLGWVKPRHVFYGGVLAVLLVNFVLSLLGYGNR